MADGYDISPYGYGPMSASAGGPANFLSGAMPGLERGIGMLAQLPLLKYQAQQMEQQRAMKGLQTLTEAMKLPRNIRGPYLKHIMQQGLLPVDQTLIDMLGKADEDQSSELVDLFTRAGADPRDARTILNVVQDPNQIVTMYNTLTKQKRDAAERQRTADIINAPPATSATPLTDQLTTPPAGAPEAEGPEQLSGPDMPTAPRPRVAPRPDRVTGVNAMQDAFDERQKLMEGQLAQLGAKQTKLVSEGLKVDDKYWDNQRQLIIDQHKPFLDALGNRITKLREPLTDTAKLFTDLAQARQAGDAEQVAALTSQIGRLGADKINDVERDVRSVMGTELPPGTSLTAMTEAQWARYGVLDEARKTRITAAGATAAANVPKFPTGTERESLTNDVTVVRQTGDIRSLYKPEFVGVVRGRVPMNMLETTGKALPGEAEFRAALAIYRNKTINLLSGAAVSPSEAARMIGQIPSETDAPDNFLAKLRATERNLNKVARERRTLYETSGVNLQGVPPIPELSPEAQDQPPRATAPTTSTRDKLRDQIKSLRRGGAGG